MRIQVLILLNIANCRIRRQIVLVKSLGMAIVTILLVLYGNYKIYQWLESEPTIPYTVSAPKAPDDAKVLEQPSVKV